MQISEFEYPLPEHLIAKHPASPRDSCRLMILKAEDQTFSHKVFTDISDFLSPGDLLVINNTKVIPARLPAQRKTGGKLDLLLIKKHSETLWDAYMHKVRRVSIEEIFEIVEGLSAKLLKRLSDGVIRIEFAGENISKKIEKYGKLPLPPYIKRELEERDKNDYQTIFAEKSGSVAAPTAGLHFTQSLIEKIREKGIEIAPITLEVSLGTFNPIKVEEVEDHTMHSERYEIPERTAEKILNARKSGKKIFAVGTTTVRTLESWGKSGKTSGETDLFIYPPYEFSVVDAIITNFHLPKSSLLLMISAFCGKEFLMNTYKEAIEEEYRFYSYGDAMLIL